MMARLNIDSLFNSGVNTYQFGSAYTDSEIFEKMISESIDILERSVKKEVANVIKNPSKTHDLIDSVTSMDKIYYRASEGTYAGYVYFEGRPKRKSRRSNGGRSRIVSNHDIAFWLEYGNYQQPARPFREKAARNVEDEILNKMQDIFNKEMGAE